MRFDNRVAIVTGGSRGIGRAVSMNLGKRGATVVVNYNKRGDTAEEVVRMITEAGGTAIAYQADVSNNDQVKNMVDHVIKKFGRVDILVNNAGISLRPPFKEHTDEIWNKVLGINLNGVRHCCRAVIPHMLKTKYGRIVNISSIAAQIGCTDCTAYATSKAGVLGYTRAIAFQFARDGITSNAVAPGTIETDMVREIPKEIRKQWVEGVPMKRAGTPDELAFGVIFLASEQASYITGQVLSINGGQYL